MPNGLRREGGARTSGTWPAIIGIGAVIALIACALVTVIAAAAERSQATERVLIFSCADDDQVACPQQLMTRYNEWAAMHPHYVVLGRQASVGVAAHNVRGYTQRYFYTMSLSVFYINKYGD